MTWPIAEARRWFDLSRDDLDALAAVAEQASQSARLRTWVLSGAEQLVAALGLRSEQPDAIRAITSPPPGVAEELAQFLPLLAFAAALPELLTFIRRREIDESVLGATLADVGRTVRKNRAWFGRSGLDPELSTWLIRHFHGAIYQLGRLQFERAGLDATTAALIEQVGGPAELGEPILSLHIPAGLGRLTPAACEDSIVLARRFFDDHFAEERPRYAICVSWLLDRQLEAYLPPASNILAFQRRFTIRTVPNDGSEEDRAVEQFVFGQARQPRHRQARRTSLERAVHQHLESGHHFYNAHGWFPWISRLLDW